MAGQKFERCSPASFVALLGLFLMGWSIPTPAAAQAAVAHARAARCLALVAYAEAAVDGRAGMEAVIRVVQNRVADPRFPNDPCAVAVQPGQFQPVSEQPRLRTALANPLAVSLEAALGGPQAVRAELLREALRLGEIYAVGLGRGDSTGGALYFVNPYFMDPEKCPWFAGLKRTAAIGGHVFMTHYRPGERAGEAAIDCSIAGTRLVKAKAPAAEAAKRVRKVFLGPLAPGQAVTASTAPTAASELAWRRSGRFAAVPSQPASLFEPSWRRLPGR
jgi:Cell Wall Hydrolase